MTTIPESLKSVSSYFKKADELEKDQSNPDCKIVAYSCRFYAIEKIMGSNPNILKEPDAKGFLMAQMSKLETEKASIKLTPADRKLVCESFAFRIFTMADEEDRHGTVTKDTARIFNAATTFFDILEQFGELGSDIQEKRKYTKFKTIDILKAIKEGRQPVRGAPGEDLNTSALQIGVSATSISTSEEKPAYTNTLPSNDQSIPTSPPPPYSTLYPTDIPTNASGTNHYDIPAAPTAAPLVMPLPPFAEKPSVIPSTSSNVLPAISKPSTASSSLMSSSTRSSMANNRITDKSKEDAIELCSFAIAALKKNDVKLARERLTEALRRLE